MLRSGHSMDGLPVTATLIDPPLADVGSSRGHQRLIYGRVQPGNVGAVLVAQLLHEHPEGVVGRFYGTRLFGFLFGDTFRPYAAEPLGEMQWDGTKNEWVQVSPALM